MALQSRIESQIREIKFILKKDRNSSSCYTGIWLQKKQAPLFLTWGLAWSRGKPPYAWTASVLPQPVNTTFWAKPFCNYIQQPILYILKLSISILPCLLMYNYTCKIFHFLLLAFFTARMSNNNVVISLQQYYITERDPLLYFYFFLFSLKVSQCHLIRYNLRFPLLLLLSLPLSSSETISVTEFFCFCLCLSVCDTVCLPPLSLVFSLAPLPPPPSPPGKTEMYYKWLEEKEMTSHWARAGSGWGLGEEVGWA